MVLARYALRVRVCVICARTLHTQFVYISLGVLDQGSWIQEYGSTIPSPGCLILRHLSVYGYPGLTYLPRLCVCSHGVGEGMHSDTGMQFVICSFLLVEADDILLVALLVGCSFLLVEHPVWGGGGNRKGMLETKSYTFMLMQTNTYPHSYMSIPKRILRYPCQ